MATGPQLPGSSRPVPGGELSGCRLFPARSGWGKWTGSQGPTSRLSQGCVPWRKETPAQLSPRSHIKSHDVPLPRTPSPVSRGLKPASQWPRACQPLAWPPAPASSVFSAQDICTSCPIATTSPPNVLIAAPRLFRVCAWGSPSSKVSSLQIVLKCRHPPSTDTPVLPNRRTFLYEAAE